MRVCLKFYGSSKFVKAFAYLEILSPPMTPTISCASTLYPMPLFVRNTFLQFEAKFTNCRKRATSAPPFGGMTVSPLITRTPTRKRNCVNPKQARHHEGTKNNDADDDDIFEEYMAITRAEAWVHISHKLIRHRFTAQKRFTLSKRQFSNAIPWMTSKDVFHARKNKILRKEGAETLEFWASGFALKSDSVRKLFDIFTFLTELAEQGECMLILPDNTTFSFPFRPNIHLDILRTKIKKEFKMSSTMQRFFCIGKELRGSLLLRDFGVRPGDVIAVF